jgi:hypothetical protein
VGIKYKLNIFYLLGRYDASLVAAVTELRTRWMDWNVTEPSPFEITDLDSFTILGPQLIEFLSQVLDDDTEKHFDLTKVKALEAAYAFNSMKNSEIEFR